MIKVEISMYNNVVLKKITVSEVVYITDMNILYDVAIKKGKRMNCFDLTKSECVSRLERKMKYH